MERLEPPTWYLEYLRPGMDIQAHVGYSVGRVIHVELLVVFPIPP